MRITKIEKVFIGIFLLAVVAFLVVEFVPFGNGSDDEIIKKEETEKISRPVEIEENIDDIESTSDEYKDVADSKEKSVSQTIVDPDEIDKYLIKSYYEKLSSKNLYGAYGMKYDSDNVSFDQFKSWYENVISAEVMDIIKKGDHKYQFNVHLKEKPSIEEKYIVNMAVKDGLLDTISSQKIWDNHTPEFYTKVVNGVRTLYLKKGDTEKVLMTIDENQQYGGYVYDSYKFLHNNKYLAYTILGNGWGYRTVHIYDVGNWKEVNLIYGPGDYGITPDGESFYQCSGMGMASGEFTVFSIPTFKKFYEATDQIVQCKGYNQDMNAYFLVTGWNQNIPKTYYFNENVMR